MAHIVQKRFLQIGSELFQSKVNIAKDPTNKTNKKYPVPSIDNTEEQTNKEKIGFTTEYNAGEHNFFGNEFSDLKDTNLRVLRNKSLTVVDSNNLITTKREFQKVPGPSFKFIEVAKEKYPIFKTQLVTSLIHLFNHFQSGPGAGNFYKFNYLFEKYGDIVGIKGLLNENILLLRKPQHINIVLGQLDGRFGQTCLFDSLRAYVMQNQTVFNLNPLNQYSGYKELMLEEKCFKFVNSTTEYNIDSNELIKRYVIKLGDLTF
uniref:Uncharacterized protein n=1 Tax=Clastoptera arizonana TaxID=38151 RepID=A0A1B6CDY9_9HEMI